MTSRPAKNSGTRLIAAAPDRIWYDPTDGYTARNYEPKWRPNRVEYVRRDLLTREAVVKIVLAAKLDGVGVDCTHTSHYYAGQILALLDPKEPT